jgi:hypothetical protein
MMNRTGCRTGSPYRRRGCRLDLQEFFNQPLKENFIGPSSNIGVKITIIEPSMKSKTLPKSRQLDCIA